MPTNPHKFTYRVDQDYGIGTIKASEDGFCVIRTCLCCADEEEVARHIPDKKRAQAVAKLFSQLDDDN